MGITGTVGTYETFYTGIPNRLHNVRLVAHLVDDKLIPPGAVFSFNRTTGDRNAAKGFLEAPVIINGELSTGLGGGVCQVSTTVFNAAYEAGLPIVERHNHALYISHYPQGRDATVNYPDVDLKFRNDSGHWLLLRMTIGDSSLVATLYGSPLHRKIVSDTGALVVNGAPPLKKVKDPELLKGQTVVDDPGAPSLSTQVERKVYAPGGKLLYDDVFHSYYVASAKVVRVGTKKPPAKTTTTGTDTTTTDTTSTGTTATSTTAKTKTTPSTTTATTTTTPQPGTD
jgi:vancomycin resistance protein YoaR